MVRILNIISDTNIGGAGNVLLNYLKYRNAAEFDVSVAIPRGSLLKGPLEDSGIEVFEIDGLADASFDFSAIKKIEEVIRKADPDIVHTHGALSGRIAAKRFGKKIIYTRHSVFPLSRKLKFGPVRLLNKIINEHYSDSIIAVSPAAAKNLTDAGISGRLITVVMNGVEPVSRFDPEERAAARSSYGLSDSDFALGILARLEEYKGHSILLDAVKALTDAGRPIKLLIAGSGAHEERIREQIRELDLAASVSMLGFVTDVASLLNAVDLQLNASYGTEATSLSLLEGMSIGLPAVVSNFGGNPWLIEDGKTGLVFKSRDSVDLTKCIERLMDDPALMAEIKNNCVDKFFSSYTGEIFAREIEDVYNKTAKGGAHGK